MTKATRALALCLALAGCAEGGFPKLPDLSRLSILPGREVTELSLRLGTLRLTAPKGYCFGPAASRPVQGFALLVRCARLTGQSPDSGLDAVLTAQLGDTDTATVGRDPQGFADFLTSDAGRALLSASGDGDTISDLSVKLADTGAVYARFQDSAARMTGAGTHLVRGFADARDRLLVVSARGNGGVELAPHSGEAVLAKLLAPIFVEHGGE